MLLKETKSIFKAEGVDIVNTANPRESIQYLGSQLLRYTETMPQNRQHCREGRKGRERKVIEHLLLTSIVLEFFIRFLQLFNPIRKEYHSYFTGGKTGLSEIKNLLNACNKSSAKPHFESLLHRTQRACSSRREDHLSLN